MALILNQAQAEAVYSAMCALNNISSDGRARIKTAIDGITEYLKVNWEYDNVLISGPCVGTEWYESQSAFATAYGLQQG